MEEQTVYIVDDVAVRDSIAELVESVGLNAEGYASALVFLEAFELERPWCLVLDVRMAEMSGLVLQEKLNEIGARIPVIMLTAHGDVPMAVQAMRGRRRRRPPEALPRAGVVGQHQCRFDHGHCRPAYACSG